MSPTLLIAINAIADVALLGLLAFVMHQPARMTPHRPRALTRRAQAPHLARRHPAAAAQRPLVRR